MGSASTPSANEPAKNLIFSPHSTAKAYYKSTTCRKNDMYCSVTASVHLKKTHLNKLMKIIIIIIMNNRKNRPFSQAPEICFRYETKSRKLWYTSNLLLYTGKSS